MRWTFAAGFKKSLIKSFFVGDESALVVDLLFVFHKALAPHFTLLFFNLLRDEEI
jgi:hypothetical protein